MGFGVGSVKRRPGPATSGVRATSVRAARLARYWSKSCFHARARTAAVRVITPSRSKTKASNVSRSMTTIALGYPGMRRNPALMATITVDQHP